MCVTNRRKLLSRAAKHTIFYFNFFYSRSVGADFIAFPGVQHPTLSKSKLGLITKKVHNLGLFGSLKIVSLSKAPKIQVNSFIHLLLESGRSREYAETHNKRKNRQPLRIRRKTYSYLRRSLKLFAIQR